MANAPSPHQQAAEQAEGALLMQNENTYLRRRVVALNIRVRELSDEVQRLAALVPDEAPDTEEETPA